jgi:excisionase family DNA binding protein
MSAMVAGSSDLVRKLSTRPSGHLGAAHNRAMTAQDIPSAGLGRFLTLVDVAEVLNISASQAYALVRTGELPAIKVGGNGRWRVERELLERYIEDKYEENRRRGLWHQAEYASVSELSAL